MSKNRIALIFWVCAAFGSLAQAQTYTFTKILDSASGFDGFEFGCPAINENGEIAIRGTRTPSRVSVVLRAGETGLTTIATSNQGFSFIGRNPAINDNGDVAFAVNLDAGGEAIVRGNGGPLTTIAQTEPGVFNFFGFDTSINNSGQVAFKAEIDNFDEGLFVGDGGPVDTRYLASSSPFGGDDSAPWINDAGQIAFEEFLDTGGVGIFLSQPNGRIVRIADDSGSISFPDVPVVNSRGVVVFEASLDNGGSAVFAGAGGQLVPLVNTGGPIGAFGFGDAALNDAGAVAFSATLDNNLQGLFIRDTAGLRDVIVIGDTLDGATVTNVIFCKGGLNNTGQLAFGAQLTGGRTAIFRGMPVL